jgi:hypothetical protein
MKPRVRQPEIDLKSGKWNPKSRSRANVIKIFAAVSYDFSKEARGLVPGKPFRA